jgi:hypothetical protein
MTNVVELKLVEVGENFRFDPDTLLEAAKGNDFGRLVIIGEHADGSLWISGTANAGESVIMMERAKHSLCGIGNG